MSHVRVLGRLGDFTLDVDFDLAPSGVTALFGASGAGKTSVIRAMAGLLTPDEGRIEVGGVTVFDSARGIDLPAEERGVGVVFQDARLFPHLSVEANLLYGASRRRGRPEKVGLGEALEVLGIENLLSRSPHTLSGGEAQRVAIGRALLSQPRVLLLDEPLASIDDERRGEVLSCLEKLRERFAVPIVYVSHALPEVVRLADTLVVMESGRVAASGALGELLGRLDIDLLCERADAGVVVECLADAYDAAAHSTRLAFAGGTLTTSGETGRPAGARLRARIAARDVAIALTPPEAASFQNVLPAVVSAVRERRRGDVLLRLQVGEAAAAATRDAVFILAAVTPEAVRRLDLIPGRRVHALLKSVALAT